MGDTVTFRFFTEEGRRPSNVGQEATGKRQKELEEQIIEQSKTLIVTNNRILQEEAKYESLKRWLVEQGNALDTLPRAKENRQEH